MAKTVALEIPTGIVLFFVGACGLWGWAPASVLTGGLLFLVGVISSVTKYVDQQF